MKHKTQGFLEARKRLQILHRQRQTTNRDGNDRSFDCDGGVDQTLDDLVDFIENNNEGADGESCLDPKKAAKKARQKQRKQDQSVQQMEERQREEAQIRRNTPAEAPKQPTSNGPMGPHGQMYPGYPNAPYTNGHQPHAPWMYGYQPGPMPMHQPVPQNCPPQMPYGMNYPMPGYPPARHPPPMQNYGYPGTPYGGSDWNQQPQQSPPARFAQPMQPDYGQSAYQQPRPPAYPSRSPTPPATSNGGASKSGTVAGLMEGFIKKQGNESAANAGSKMVTIRRVMEPHSSDPTVTISMKGDTPEQDKLMFTLVNGQVIPSSDLLRSGIPVQGNDAQAPPNDSSEAKKKKRRKKKKKTASNEAAEPEVEATVVESLQQAQQVMDAVQEPFEQDSAQPSPVLEPESPPSPPPSPIERREERRDESPGVDSVSLSSLTSRSSTPKPTEGVLREECEGAAEAESPAPMMETDPAVEKPINIVVESEEDDTFVDAKEHLSPRSDMNRTHEEKLNVSSAIEDKGEELADKLRSELIVSDPNSDEMVKSEVNALSSLPDILENGDKLDCIAARIDQLQQMIKAGDQSPETAQPVVLAEEPKSVTRELMETNKTLEALAQKIRTLKLTSQKPQGHSPQQRCDACSDCNSGAVKGAPVSRLKQKLLSKRSAAAKKEEQLKPPVETESRKVVEHDADSEDEQGETLLKNLKLPPDITITRVKSADGKRSYNFRRQNASLAPSEPAQKPPARGFQPSVPASISISPITAAQSSSTASTIANAAAAAAAADSSWNKNVIVVDSQKEQMNAGPPYGAPAGFGSGMQMGFGGPGMGRPGMPPPPAPVGPHMNHAHAPPYWNNMYGFNGPQMPHMPGMAAPQPYGMQPPPMFPPRFPQPPAPQQNYPQPPPPQQRAKEQEKKQQQAEQPLNKKARRKLKRAEERAAAAEEQQQQQPPAQPVPPPAPPMWPPPQVPGWVYIPAPPPLPAGVMPSNDKKDASPPPGQPAFPYYYQYVDPNTNAVVYYVVGATVPSAVPPQQAEAKSKDTNKSEKIVDRQKENSSQKPQQQGKKGKKGKEPPQQQPSKKQQKGAKAAATVAKVDSNHPLSQFYSAAHDGSGPRVPSPMSDAVPHFVHQHGAKQEVNAGGDGGGKKKNKKKKGKGAGKSGEDIGPCESVFVPKNVDLEDETLDETEKELEAFKRFCFASVPRDRKEKVNLNIRDIIMKKQRAGES